MQSGLLFTLAHRRKEGSNQRILGWAALLLLAILIAWLPLRIALLLVGGVGAALLLIRWPWLAWIGLAVALPFASAVKFGRLSAADLLLAGGLALWFADGVRRRSLRLDPRLLPGFVAIYLAVILSSVLWAVDLVEAAAEVIKWIEVLIVVWVVGQFLSPGQKRWLAAALLVGGALQALLGIYQFLFRIGPPSFLLADRFMRAAGTFDQPNPYAGYLGLTLPVSVSLALWSWGKLPSAGWSLRMLSIEGAWALFYTAAAGIIGLGIVASWSRGGWLGALAGVAVVIVFRSRKALILSLAAGLLAIVALGVTGLNPALIPAPIIERLAELPAYLGFGIADLVNQPVTDENFAVIERLAHWLAALRMWDQAPWLGVGAGNYAAVYPEVRLPLWKDPLGHAHNIYLNILAETGLIGLSAYLLMWILIIGWLWKVNRGGATGSWGNALRIGVFGVIAHLTLHHVFDNLFVQGIYLHLAFWLAAADVSSFYPTESGSG
ncbi:MAG: O-antigen ligase family protein [Caldilineaceae bacterium]|nr:O-antigen ligase family protein [Caldilineaceae bacterium]